MLFRRRRCSHIKVDREGTEPLSHLMAERVILSLLRRGSTNLGLLIAKNNLLSSTSQRKMRAMLPKNKTTSNL
jgi:hypothetical protein